MTGEVENVEGCAAEEAYGSADNDSAECDADAIIEEPAIGPCEYASERSPTKERF